MPKPKFHIVVCTNSRPPGHPKPSCGAAGSPGVLMAFNIGLMERGYMPGQVLVTSSSCLGPCEQGPDRKSTRLNSSHDQISYAVFCLKKKKKIGKRNPVGKLKTY